MRWAIAGLLLLLAACEAEIPACPGAAQGTLALHGTATDAGTTCAFQQAAIATARQAGNLVTFDLTATVAWTDASTSVLCIQRPLSVARFGTRNGDSLTVSYSLPGVTIASCPCAVDLQETLAGALQRTTASTSATGFKGTLVDHFTRNASAGACYAATDAATLAAGCPGEATTGSDGGCDASYDAATAGTP